MKSVQGWTWPLPGTGRVAGPRNASGSLSREAVVVLMLFHIGILFGFQCCFFSPFAMAQVDTHTHTIYIYNLHPALLHCMVYYGILNVM